MAEKANKPFNHAGNLKKNNNNINRVNKLEIITNDFLSN